MFESPSQRVNKTVKIKKPTKGKLVTFDEFKEIGKKVMKRTKK